MGYLISCQSLSDLRTTVVVTYNLQTKAAEANMAECLVRCEQCNGLVSTDKVCRKYLAILPCVVAVNLFPVQKNEDD